MTAGHKVECLADDVAWGDELRLPGDVLVEGHVWKSALRPLLGISALNSIVVFGYSFSLLLIVSLKKYHLYL